jgi:hypothetical protein
VPLAASIILTECDYCTDDKHLFSNNWLMDAPFLVVVKNFPSPDILAATYYFLEISNPTAVAGRPCPPSWQPVSRFA